MKFDEKRIVLTGAASGIGRALLEKLAPYSAQVLAADRDQAGLAALKIAGATQISTYACDLGEPAAVEGLFERALQNMGGIDLFIANTGFAYYEKIEQPAAIYPSLFFRIFIPLPFLPRLEQILEARRFQRWLRG